MQISDLIGQYNQNVQTPKENLTGVKGVERLVQTLQSMKAGNIFEGTVNSMKNGQVVLGLSNGQTLQARIDGKVPITQGQSMFFQVKSNSGNTIAIRPFMVDGTTGNLTLLDALKAAGLPAEPRNLNMVNAMMQEQLPIDKEHVMQMARTLQNNPDISEATLVQLQKLNIPISVENATQFENYRNDRQAIGAELENLMEELPQVMGDSNLSAEELTAMNKQLLAIITSGQEPDTVENLSQSIAENTGDVGTEEMAEITEKAVQEEVTEANEESVAEDLPETVSQKPVLSSHAAGSLLSSEELKEFSNQLKAVGMDEQNSPLFSGGELREDATAKEVLDQLSKFVDKEGFSQNEKELISKLFSGKGFQTMVKDSLEEQWMVKPEELAKEDKIEDLYRKLDTQLRQMEEVTKAVKGESASFTQNAADIRNNMSFMEQINQTYTYVQIPLKMKGQNANGELFVYTNKKSLAEGTKDLTAFLHLDMDHLGSTDVSLRLHQKEISTSFYFDNDESFELVQAHLGELEERLEKKGYTCKLQVINEGKKVNFVEDFLKKDQPSAGQLRRYSFDMRA